MKHFILILLIALSIGAIATSFVYDRPVRDSIIAGQEKGWNQSPEGQFWGNVSRHGDWPQLMVFGALMLGLAIKLRRKDWIQLVAAAMLASTVAGIFANASRLTTGRARPRDEPKIGAGFHGPWVDGKLTIGNSRYNAYPSGHTATAIGFAAPFLFAKPALGVFLFLGAIGIAWSRMQLGAHHLSDVVTSILLGLFVSWFVLKWVSTKGEATWKKLVGWVKSFLKKSQTPPPSSTPS